MRVYAMRDMSAERFSNPVFAESDAVVMRDVRLMLADEDVSGSIMTVYPEDFALYYIGDYDVRTGVISSSDHVKLCLCSDLMVGVSDSES